MLVVWTSSMGAEILAREGVLVVLLRCMKLLLRSFPRAASESSMLCFTRRVVKALERDDILVLCKYQQWQGVDESE